MVKINHNFGQYSSQFENLHQQQIYDNIREEISNTLQRFKGEILDELAIEEIRYQLENILDNKLLTKFHTPEEYIKIALI